MKYFTVESAEALIPDFESIFSHALDIHAKAEKKAKTVSEVEAEGKDPARLAIERSQLQFMVAAINECLQKIADQGALPKGLEPALVDFPHRIDGREVYLCWKRGEKSITHYHDIASGFSGREPLPSRKTA